MTALDMTDERPAREREWIERLRALIKTFTTDEGRLHPCPSTFKGRERLEFQLLSAECFNDQCCVQVLGDDGESEVNIRFVVHDEEERACEACAGMGVASFPGDSSPSGFRPYCHSCRGRGCHGPYSFILEIEGPRHKQPVISPLLDLEFDFS